MKLPVLFAALSCGLLAQEQGPIMSSILPRYQAAKINLVEAAEFMPADQYGFKLTPPQRSFGDWIEHNVEMNYNLCSDVMGAARPDVAKYRALKTKDELVSALKESFHYCDQAFESMSDHKALQPVLVAGKPMPPVNPMIGLLINWNQHYGNLVGYLRTKGIVPPTTARVQQQKK